MALTKCANDHLYDSDLYSSCPYCNGGGNAISFDGPGKTTPLGNMGGGSPDPIGQPAPDAFASVEPGATVAPAGYRKRQDDDNKTVSVSRKKTNLEPVTGWLVCIDGPDKGRDYHLYDKQNTVGRGEGMDIRIEGDKTISRDRHARIAYDSRHNNFTLIPADSTNNIYVNDEPVYIPRKLDAYDCVEFGESKFVFVPLCCPRFTWADGLVPAPKEE